MEVIQRAADHFDGRRFGVRELNRNSIVGRSVMKNSELRFPASLQFLPLYRNVPEGRIRRQMNRDYWALTRRFHSEACNSIRDLHVSHVGCRQDPKRCTSHDWK